MIDSYSSFLSGKPFSHMTNTFVLLRIYCSYGKNKTMNSNTNIFKSEVGIQCPFTSNST